MARTFQNLYEENTNAPLLSMGWVTGQNTLTHSVNVILPDGQELLTDVTVLEHGPSDPWAKKQTELPRRGTYGLIAFPYRDTRNGIWLGSLDLNLNSAINAASSATSPFQNYFAKWNGSVDFEDEFGQISKLFTDQSYIQIGSTTTLPTFYKQVYNGTNATETPTAYPTSQRRINPQPPFNFFFKHFTGTTLEVLSNGEIKVSTNIGSSLTMLPTGFVTISSSAGNFITLAPTGSITISVATGQTVNLLNTPTGLANDSLALVSLLVSWFNAHTHSGVSSGTSASGPPMIPSIPADFASAIAKTEA